FQITFRFHNWGADGHLQPVRLQLWIEGLQSLVLAALQYNWRLHQLRLKSVCVVTDISTRFACPQQTNDKKKAGLSTNIGMQVLAHFLDRTKFQGSDREPKEFLS